MSFILSNFKYLRKKHNCTQTDMGELLNIPRGTVGAIEEARQSISLDLAVKMAKVFNYDVETLHGKDLKEIPVYKKGTNNITFTKPEIRSAFFKVLPSEPLWSVFDAYLTT